MSMLQKTLRCGFCGHEWEGLWDVESSLQADSITACPQCSSLRGKPKIFGEPADTDNYFAVGFDDDAGAAEFQIPGLHGDKVFRLQGTLPKEMALNLAAWLVRVTDPTGEDFQRLYEEIKKR
jgi:DNA-directed RNA polymerase subunit RPC12/RpoP